MVVQTKYKQNKPLFCKKIHIILNNKDGEREKYI